MRFYTETRHHYCGIDLHARSLYVCIVDHTGNVLIHKEIKAAPEPLLRLITPFLDQLVIGVECMHCWYWIADFCRDQGIEFILGHALYMRAIHGGKAKNDRIDSHKIAMLMRGGNFPLAYVYPSAMRATRDLLRRRIKMVRYSGQFKAHVSNTATQYNRPSPAKGSLRLPTGRSAMSEVFDDVSVQRNVDMDLNLVDCFDREISQVERFIEQQAKHHNPRDLTLLKTIHGIGRILALAILYEIGDIDRFDTVQQFASYGRLVKCKAESAGKNYGTQGNKIGNAHLKWAFSEAVVCHLRGNPKAQAYLDKLQRRMSKGKALSVLAHKLGRCVYFMLKNGQVFDEQRFLG
jgi:transposase